MKLVSFNVNGIRARLHQLQALRDTLDPDVIGLQEVKVVDEDFPVAAVEEIGYHVRQFGQKGHYGVALLSKRPPLEVTYGFEGDDADAQRRLITGRFETEKGNEVTVINGYFPQGESRSHPTKFPAKEKFYLDLLQTLNRSCDPKQNLVVMGDFNIAITDLDIGIGADNAKRWLRTGKTSFLPEEREWMAKILQWGLTDSFRQMNPQVDDCFSWFDYRTRGFDREPKSGLRIDGLLVTQPVMAACREVGVDYDMRAMNKPSDHCPVWGSFDI